MATTQTLPAGSGSARIACVAATPSITGMCTSISTRSKAVGAVACCTACTASSPFSTRWAWCPSRASKAARYMRLTGWSSATNTRSGRADAGSATGAIASVAATGSSGQRKLNTLPAPGVLLTTISPPISRARLRDMASPKPAPPKRATRPSVARPWRWNRWARVSRSMPMPLSQTLNSSRAGPSSTGAPWRQFKTMVPACPR